MRLIYTHNKSSLISDDKALIKCYLSHLGELSRNAKGFQCILNTQEAAKDLIMPTRLPILTESPEQSTQAGAL